MSEYENVHIYDENNAAPVSEATIAGNVAINAAQDRVSEQVYLEARNAFNEQFNDGIKDFDVFTEKFLEDHPELLSED